MTCIAYCNVIGSSMYSSFLILLIEESLLWWTPFGFLSYWLNCLELQTYLLKYDTNWSIRQDINRKLLSVLCGTEHRKRHPLGLHSLRPLFHPWSRLNLIRIWGNQRSTSYIQNQSRMVKERKQIFFLYFSGMWAIHLMQLVISIIEQIFFCDRSNHKREMDFVSLSTHSGSCFVFVFLGFLGQRQMWRCQEKTLHDSDPPSWYKSCDLAHQLLM